MPDSKGYSYNKYGDKTNPVLGNQFAGRVSEKHLDVTKTKMQPVPARANNRMGFNKHSMPGVSRPAHQRADTISGASLGKAPGWQTRGDVKKRVLNRAYSMNQVSMARIMKANVNSNEGAYMKRGGDRQT